MVSKYNSVIPQSGDPVNEADGTAFVLEGGRGLD